MIIRSMTNLIPWWGSPEVDERLPPNLTNLGELEQLGQPYKLGELGPGKLNEPHRLDELRGVEAGGQ